jgi:hypothetical protein
LTEANLQNILNDRSARDMADFNSEYHGLAKVLARTQELLLAKK